MKAFDFDPIFKNLNLDMILSRQPRVVYRKSTSSISFFRNDPLRNVNMVNVIGSPLSSTISSADSLTYSLYLTVK